jgi:hypothetical protein
LKGLSDCFAYRIKFTEIDELHSCNALEPNKRTEKPFCVGKDVPSKCSFYKTRAQYDKGHLDSLKRKIKDGWALSDEEKKQYRALRSKYGG